MINDMQYTKEEYVAELQNYGLVEWYITLSNT